MRIPLVIVPELPKHIFASTHTSVEQIATEQSKKLCRLAKG